MAQVQREVERFRLKSNEKKLIQMAAEAREHAYREADALYTVRSGAILVEHDMSPNTRGQFIRVDNDIVFQEFVTEEVEEAEEAPVG